MRKIVFRIIDRLTGAKKEKSNLILLLVISCYLIKEEMFITHAS